MALTEQKTESGRRHRGKDYVIVKLDSEQGVAEIETYVSERSSRKGYKYYIVVIPKEVVRSLGLENGTSIRVRIEKLSWR